MPLPNEMFYYVAVWGTTIQAIIVLFIWWLLRLPPKEPRPKLNFMEAIQWAVLPALIPVPWIIATAPWWLAYINSQAQAALLCFSYPICLLIIGYTRWDRQ